MAGMCVCCGKKIGFMGNFRNLLNDDKVICDKCFSTFENDYYKMVRAKEHAEIEAEYKATLDGIECGTFSKEGKEYVKEFVNRKRIEMLKQISDSELKKQQEQEENEILQKRLEEENARKEYIKNNIVRLRNEFMLTTGYNFEGHRIVAYLGVLSGSVVKGTGFFSETSAAINDILGTEVTAFSNKLEFAKDMAMSQLKDKAILTGANAVIGIDFDYITLSNNMIGVVANGTAVMVEKI